MSRKNTAYILLRELHKPKEIDAFRKNASGYQEVDTRDPSWMDSLHNFFAKHGFRSIGSGKYSSVFENPKYPYIIKVFMKDAAFLRWMKFCRANPDNPYCPKFKGKLAPLTNNFFAMRVEKLTPYIGSINSINEFLHQFIRLAEEGDNYAKDVYDYCSLPENKKLLDIHSGNLMKRGNQIVIIDPFYNWFKGGKYIMDPHDFDWKN